MLEDACPCKDCTERFVGCHSACLKYIDWKQAHDVLKKQQLDAKMQYVEAHEYEKNVHLRVMKNKIRRRRRK